MLPRGVLRVFTRFDAVGVVLSARVEEYALIVSGVSSGAGLNLATTWKMDIINGGYGTTTQLHQGNVDLEKTILDYQKQEKG